MKAIGLALLCVVPTAARADNTLRDLAALMQISAASGQMSAVSALLSEAAERRKHRCACDAECSSACDEQQPEEQRSSELFLRDRSVQLREELALGKGPVTTWLAALGGVAPAKLGQALRSNRVELAKLIGDPSRTEWPNQFLRRVEELERECDRS